MRVVEVNNIPTDVYINAKQVRDIYVMTLPNLENVKLVSVITGLETNVTRKELTKEYRWLNNRKIVLCGCKKSKTYKVTKMEEADCRAVYIPSNNKIQMPDGNIEDVDKSSFLVIDDRYEEPYLVDRSLFRAAYIYAENPGDAASRIKNMNGNTEGHKKVKVTVKKEVPIAHTNTHEAPKPIKYKAVARYMRGKELLGFKLISTQGEAKDITIAGAAKLAHADKIVNLAWSDGGTNKAHFRGKGMNISDIPIIRK